jgi:hypothetical protein
MSVAVRLAVAESRAALSPSDVRLLAWLGAGAAAGVTALALTAEMYLLFLSGAVATAVTLAFLAPEATLALFVVAGAIKEAPWLSPLPIDLTLLAAVAVVAAIVARAARRGLPPFPAATGLMVALTSLIVLSVLWSPDPGAALDLALRFQFLTLLGFVAPTILIGSRRSLRRMMVSLAAFGVLIAATAVPTDDVNKPLTVYGGIEIELGLDVGIGLVAAAGYLFFASSSPSRWLWLVPASFMAWIVIVAGSRGALIAAALGLGYVMVAHFIRTPRLRTSAVVLVIGGLVGAAAIAAGLAGQAGQKYETALFSTDTGSVLGLRGYLFHRGWELALDHPFGLGAAGFQSVTGLNHPHNILLQLADEQGLLAVVLFLTVTVAAWRARRLAPGGLGSPEAIAAGGLIVFLLVQALASLDINQDKPLWFAYGLAFALRTIPDEP